MIRLAPWQNRIMSRHGTHGRAAVLGLAVAAMLGSTLTAMAADEKPAGVVWHEGEDYAEAPAKEVKTVGEKGPASGTRSLWGMAMNKKGLVVRYEANLPQALPNVRIIFRYGRQHWKADMTAAKVPLVLSMAVAKNIDREVVFDHTGGWGDKPNEWGLAVVKVGYLPAGQWTLTLTSPADDSDICLDGFWIAPASLKLAPEEFAALLRVRMGADGYLGLRACTMALDQKAGKNLLVVVRDFGGAAAPVKVSLTNSAGKAVELTAVMAQSEGASGAQRLAFDLGGLPDGTYAMKAITEHPALALETQVTLAGELLGGLEARTARLAAFAKELPSLGVAAQACKDDFDYAVEYLTANGMELRHYAASADGNAGLDYVAGIKVREGDVLFENITRMVGQYEETMSLLRAKKDPYAGRTGDLRRAFYSQALDVPVHTRLYVPSGYAKADKVPLILTLHGGRGNEDGMPNVQKGKIIELAERRGYLLVCPAYSTDRDGKYMGGLLDVIARVRAEYPKVDPDRIYATGFSMGGFASAQLGAFHPEVFAAVSCQGGAGREEWAPKLKIPVQVVQGAADAVVKPEVTAKVVDAMKAAGVAPDVHVIPFAGHEYLAEQYMTLAMDFFDKHAGRKAPATTSAPTTAADH